MQTDPVGYADNMNLYAYVGNDPVNGVDPLGLYSCSSSGDTKTCEGTSEEMQDMVGEMDGYQITDATQGFFDSGLLDTVSAVVERADPNSETKIARMGMDGHAGIGVGNDYWDYGPANGRDGTTLLGTEGGPYWDAGVAGGDASLADIEAGTYASIYTRIVTAEQASQVRSYWNNLYANPGTYRFYSKNCTSTAAASLRNAGLGSFGALRPATFIKQLERAGWKKRR